MLIVDLLDQFGHVADGFLHSGDHRTIRASMECWFIKNLPLPQSVLHLYESKERFMFFGIEKTDSTAFSVMDLFFDKVSSTLVLTLA